MSLALAVGGVATALVGGRLVLAQRSVADRSIFLLGRGLADEAALSARVGAPVGRFYGLAQRALWGILQPDLIRADVDGACAALAGELGGLFASHVVIAFVRRARGQAQAADEALARARELARPEHPFSHVLPSAAEWACEAPPVALEEVVPGVLWRVPVFYTHGLVPFHEFAYATVIRRRSGEVVLLNPVAMPEAIAAEIRAIGPVTHLVTPLKFHNLFVAEGQRLFPGARSFGVAGHRKNPPSAHLRFDGILDDRAPLFPGEIEQVAIAGHQFEETVFFHPESRTAFVHDLIFGCQPGRPGYTFWWRLYCLVFGIHDGFGVPSYHPMLWTNVPRLRASVARVLAWDADRVLCCHAPASAIEAGGREVLEGALGWVRDLGTAEHAVMVGRYFREQPGFMRDLLRYLVKQGG